MTDFETFRVLLDEPAADPALGYGGYAKAFADVIRHSEPQFAVGIFGDWGAGKTTLMKAIERELEHDRDVVSVWFNAWRYEREQDLIVPLLDTLREQLEVWAQQGRSSQEETRARRAAAAVGRAARALIAATTFKAGVGAVNVELRPRDAIEAWAAQEGDAPLSFYYRSFNAMTDAIAEFIGSVGDDRPRRRVVVFIDDLDRCLPNSALQVLESMKLFFDLSGFVFVVGLDRDVIERSIEAKYGATHNGGSSGGGPPDRQAIKGADYIKKIFQLPFGLPRISVDDLRPFFDSVIEKAPVPDAQRDDLRTVVWPHIEASTSGSSVNPREVKRLVNAYTLQMKMLTVKLAPRNKVPDPNVVLALQTMAFRADWERFYDILTRDPALFIDALRRLINGQLSSTAFPLTAEPLPRSFIEYVKTRATAILNETDLDVYVSTAEATRSSDPTVLEAQGVVTQITQVVQSLGRPGSGTSENTAVSELHDRLSILTSLLGRRQSPLVSEATLTAKSLADFVKQRVPSPSMNAPAEPPEWATQALRQLEALQETLAAMRQEAFVGSASS